MRMLSWLCGTTLLAIAIAACGGSSSNTSSSRSKFNTCSTQSSSGSTCTGTAEFDACLESKCASSYKKCYGDDYQSGKYGGACAAYLDCADKAADPCKPTGCTRSAECQTCLDDEIVGCAASANCTPPRCTTTGTAGTSSGTGGR